MGGGRSLLLGRMRGWDYAIAGLGLAELSGLFMTRILVAGRGAVESGFASVNFPAFPLVEPRVYYLLVVAAVILVLVLLERLQDTFWARVWTTLEDDEMAAAALGIESGPNRLKVDLLSSMIGVLAGVLWAGWSGFGRECPFVFCGLREALLLLAVVVAGRGLGRGGVVLATLLLVSLDILLPVLLPPGMRDLREIIWGGIMLITVLCGAFCGPARGEGEGYKR